MSRSSIPPRGTARGSDPGFRRLALAPGLLAAVVLLAGVAGIGSEAYLVVRFLVAILVIVMGVFAVQARQWWWLPLLGAVAVLWNPVVPLELPGAWQLGAHYAAIAVVVLVGALVKVPHQEESSGRSR